MGTNGATNSYFISFVVIQQGFMLVVGQHLLFTTGGQFGNGTHSTGCVQNLIGIPLTKLNFIQAVVAVVLV